MSVNVSARIDEIIRDLESKLSKWKAVKDAVGDDKFRAEMMTLLGESHAKANGKPRKPGKRSKILDKLQAFFAARGNQWATLAEIDEGGISKSSARQLLYMSHVDHFERVSKKEGDRQTRFRLKKASSHDSGDKG